MLYYMTIQKYNLQSFKYSNTFLFHRTGIVEEESNHLIGAEASELMSTFLSWTLYTVFPQIIAAPRLISSPLIITPPLTEIFKITASPLPSPSPPPPLP